LPARSGVSIDNLHGIHKLDDEKLNHTFDRFLGSIERLMAGTSTCISIEGSTSGCGALASVKDSDMCGEDENGPNIWQRDFVDSMKISISRKAMALQFRTYVFTSIGLARCVAKYLLMVCCIIFWIIGTSSTTWRSIVATYEEPPFTAEFLIR